MEEPQEPQVLRGTRATLEALLLVAVEPVSTAALATVLEISPLETLDLLCGLRDEYEADGRGFQLREFGGAWRLYTHPACHEPVQRFIHSWDAHRLTQAALETLSIIAYCQPATRDAVKAIRGVNSDSAISSLIEKGLVRELPHKDGVAAVFGTTKTFLERYGLSSIDDLPPLEDFAPDEETRALIAERLSAPRFQPTFDDIQTNDQDTYTE